MNLTVTVAERRGSLAAGRVRVIAAPAGCIGSPAMADAADQAGISRLYGGIHVRSDDLRGRVIGEACGRAAWSKALTYIGGAA